MGDNYINDHFWGYSDGYFHGVINAKFGNPNEGTGDYPEVKAYVRDYAAGLKDSAEIAAAFSKEEKVAFAEGFSDGLLDGKDRCP